MKQLQELASKAEQIRSEIGRLKIELKETEVELVKAILDAVGLDGLQVKPEVLRRLLIMKR